MMKIWKGLLSEQGFRLPVVDAGRIIVQGAAVGLRAEIARQDLEVEIPQTIIKRKKIGYDNR